MGHSIIRGSRVLTLFLMASLLTSDPTYAENAMGYRLLSAEEAAGLPATRGSLGMDVERSGQISDGGMTFDVIRIKQLRPRSPAAQAGFRPGDQIIAVNGRVFPSLVAFGSYVGSLPPGTTALFDYIPAGGGPSNAQRATVSLGAAGSQPGTSSWTIGQK